VDLTGGAREGAAGAIGPVVVVRVDFGSCVLQAGDGTLSEATVRGKLMGPRKALGNAVVVGDSVQVEQTGGRPVITEVAPRRNSYSRRAAGTRPVEQVVAADLDQVALVASLSDPPFSAGLADRVLCQAEHCGLPARLVLNKCDLGESADARTIVAAYERAGYPGHVVSAKSGAGIEALREACRGLRTLFIGHSGVGKSTLLNALTPGIGLLAGHVNAKTGKGRHTTTAALLLRPEPGFEVIDTPGVRAFGLWGIGPDDLQQSYPEFRRFIGACRFRDCRHVTEPACALRQAVVAGDVAPLRMQSFLKLRAELEEEIARG
jgi:ribosome biogenesis GTPase